jgi:endoglucanase
VKRFLAAIAIAALLVAVPQAAEAKTPKQIFPGGLFVQPDSEAAVILPSLTGAEKKAAKYISKRSVAIWLGDWYDGDVLVEFINRNLAAAEAAGKTPVFVTYALPGRDCGGHSAGGFDTAHYLDWNRLITKTLKGHRAVVLVEPDSLSTFGSCPNGTEQFRLPLLKKVTTILAKSKATIYLDGGISNANDPKATAKWLKGAGISKARGFFTNVSNYRTTSAEQAYAKKVSKLTGNSHYVIDISRNGTGYHNEWCNAPGAGLGKDPRVANGKSKLDALLWVKTPGASDGTCNGGPTAGQWFGGYAVALFKNRAK